ncbi:uncharacterized protein [Atheta coriaria]|uniref:uncharacterized protein n=1 Tax=Dalotia coriaria TaxID=877792 RepID=UPI0031F3D22D
MEAVHKARNRFRQYPAVLAKCSKEGSLYAKCVLKKDSVALNDCANEFQQFKICLQKTAVSMKTRL